MERAMNVRMKNGDRKSKKTGKKNNMQRLGGGGRGGLSLEAFANAKTKTNTYNPAIIKKQREFYKNAKYVSKYKRIMKQHGEPSDGARHVEDDGQDIERAAADKEVDTKNKKKSGVSLREIYERKREEDGKARMETEAAIQARKEERQGAEARRKELRGKMLKKTRSGQPVMKYRIQHILETLEGSKED
ncbi:hypothetical protein FXO38_10647 [Capsicum annuum]|uniref:rRNA-processing protein FYV7 n=1 Tax=Capsicum annuum TaxID=4072 RepID=A0A1U8H1I5_CAPAN|nr:uncharacterized protein LOC107875216 isoform X2 [Capsicum annuum]KAF3663406.1 hypothetical protein FXO38_10647 [Capsicum annuum]PHT80535.1 hypothetical protein T459_18587 [Capsicum annuum]